jgi:hypothetical protein
LDEAVTVGVVDLELLQVLLVAVVMLVLLSTFNSQLYSLTTAL